jgi:hypothetical protein
MGDKLISKLFHKFVDGRIHVLFIAILIHIVFYLQQLLVKFFVLNIYQLSYIFVFYPYLILKLRELIP